MKNKFLTLSLVAFSTISVISLCGCEKNNMPESGTLELNSLDEIIVDDYDSIDPNTLTAQIEETEEEFTMTKVIWLDENPTTGYQWNYEIADESIAVVEGDEYTPNNVEKGIVGAGGVHAYRLSGLKEGTTTITFNYSRSWEQNVDPIQTKTFTIIVDANNFISIIQ